MILQPANTKKIETYLNDVSLSLRCMPAEEAAETRDELRLHLDALVSELRKDGMSEEDAVTRALKKFGSPHRVGHELGKTSIKEFLRGLDQAVPISARCLRSAVKVGRGISYFPIVIIITDPGAVWPYYVVLGAGFVVGVLESFDSPSPPDKIRARMIDEVAEKLAARANPGETLWASLKHLMATQALKSMRRQTAIAPLGSLPNPLKELDWRFFYSLIFWSGAALLSPNLRGFSKVLFLSQIFWYAARFISGTAAWGARKIFTLGVR